MEDKIRIIMMYEVPREDYENVMAQDAKPEDILEAINDLARAEMPTEVYYFEKADPSGMLDAFFHLAEPSTAKRIGELCARK